MFKAFVAAAVILCLACAAMADPIVLGQIYYPDSTTWQLYLMECDSADANTPAGFGICGFSVDLYGALPGAGNSWPDGDFSNTSQVKDSSNHVQGLLGWSTTGNSDVNDAGQVTPIAGQNLVNSQLLCYNFGVSADQYNKPAGWKIDGNVNAVYAYGGPADPGTGVPGVLVWTGLRAADNPITWGSDTTSRYANVFPDANATIVSGVPLVMVGNLPPTVTAQTTRSITLPYISVAISGTVTDDGLPNPPAAVTHTWSEANGLPGVIFADANALSTTVTFTTTGTYTLQLSASDGAASATSDATVNVVPVGTQTDVSLARTLAQDCFSQMNHSFPASMWVLDYGVYDPNASNADPSGWRPPTADEMFDRATTLQAQYGFTVFHLYSDALARMLLDAKGPQLDACGIKIIYTMEGLIIGTLTADCEANCPVLRLGGYMALAAKFDPSVGAAGLTIQDDDPEVIYFDGSNVHLYDDANQEITQFNWYGIADPNEHLKYFTITLDANITQYPHAAGSVVMNWSYLDDHYELEWLHDANHLHRIAGFYTMDDAVTGCDANGNFVLMNLQPVQAAMQDHLGQYDANHIPVIWDGCTNSPPWSTFDYSSDYVFIGWPLLDENSYWTSTILGIRNFLINSHAKTIVLEYTGWDAATQPRPNELDMYNQVICHASPDANWQAASIGFYNGDGLSMTPWDPNLAGSLSVGAWHIMDYAAPGTPVIAMSDQTIFDANVLTLSASVSDDGLPDPPAIVTVHWSASGPGDVIFADANALTTTATFTRFGVYTLGLSAFDGAQTGHNTATVRVLLGADFNENGVVDGIDFLIWQRNYNHGTAASGAPIVDANFSDPNYARAHGDATGDGKCDGSDFLAWQRGYMDWINSQH